MERNLKQTDIVVYKGVISILGLFQGFIPITESDEVRLATKEELDLYNKRPEA